MSSEESPSSNTPVTPPQLTLYFLQCSRSIRIAWLLEELGLPYTLKFYERDKNSKNGIGAPEAFIKESGGSMGKAPVLVDGGIVIQESGAITEYLLSKYDPLNQLLPLDPTLHSKCLTYIHAAEGTFLLHGLVPFYISLASVMAASDLHPQLVQATGQDMDWLESELQGESGGRYLLGDRVTAADTMMAFSVQFLRRFDLVPRDREWPLVGKWLENVEGNQVYQRAVAKTGHKLEL